MAARGRLLIALLLTQPSVAWGSVPADLQCQMDDAAWVRCRMVVEADGLRWRVELDGIPYWFRHDGLGGVSMRRGTAAWHTVQTRWRRDASLCWNGLCAKGAIPLD